MVVVFNPLRNRHTSVAFVGCNVAVMLLESVEELKENLVLCLLACLYLGMLFRVVYAADVRDVDRTTSVFVHDFKGFQGNISPEVVHFTAHAS